MVLGKDRHIDQWNRIEDPEISPYNYSHLYLNNGAKNKHWRKDNLSNKRCHENWTSTFRRLKLDSYCMPYTKVNSKLIEDLF
jgi:hypothetical protein